MQPPYFLRNGAARKWDPLFLSSTRHPRLKPKLIYICTKHRQTRSKSHWKLIDCERHGVDTFWKTEDHRFQYLKFIAVEKKILRIWWAQTEQVWRHDSVIKVSRRPICEGRSCEENKTAALEAVRQERWILFFSFIITSCSILPVSKMVQNV